MSKLSITIPHNLTQSEALNQIQKFLPELKEKHADKISDLQESWSGSTGTFELKISGFKVSGTLKVTDSAVIIDGTIPLLAVAFRSQIENAIIHEAEALF